MKYIQTFETHNLDPNKILLFLKAKHFKDIHYSPYIGSPELCVLQHAFLDQFGREGDAQKGYFSLGENDKDFFLDLENNIDYVYDEYIDDDFELDFNKAKSLNWDDTVIRTITLIEDPGFENLKATLKNKKK